MKVLDIVLINNLIKEIDLNKKIGIIIKIDDNNKYTLKLYNYKNKIIKLDIKFIKQIFPKTLLVGGFDNINDDILLEYFSNNDKIVKINDNFRTIKLVNNKNNFLLKPIIQNPLILFNDKIYNGSNYFNLLKNYDNFSNDLIFYLNLQKILKKYNYNNIIFIFFEGLLYKEDLQKLSKNWIMTDIIL